MQTVFLDFSSGVILRSHASDSNVVGPSESHSTVSDFGAGVRHVHQSGSPLGLQLLNDDFVTSFHMAHAHEAVSIATGIVIGERVLDTTAVDSPLVDRRALSIAVKGKAKVDCASNSENEYMHTPPPLVDRRALSIYLISSRI